MDCGADMVLTKPVEVRALRACLRNLIKKDHHKPGKNTLQVGDLRLNLRTRKVTRSEVEIVLRRKEYEILECLMLNAGNIVSKELLLEHAWDYGLEVMSNTLEVHIRNLRNKIDRPFGTKTIRTVRGFGYKVCE
jgi:two-component system OmpR family response regulator